VTQDPSLEPPAQADTRPTGSLLFVRAFAVALGGLLVGYMFLGRGFAHISIGGVYVGESVLLLGIATAAFVAIRARFRAPVTWTVALLLAFAGLGALRTLPYLGTHGMDALRDGVLWGYAAFALIVYLLADRAFLLRAFRLYGWVVPIFALWLPISWNLFAAASADIDPSRPGSFIPLVFFKGGDMAVHTVGAIAFLVLGASAVWSTRTFLWRVVIALPLLWTLFVAGTSNRGALVTATVGIVAVAIIARRSRNWLPLLAATGLFAIAVVFQGLLAETGGSAPTAAEPTLTSSESPTSSPSGQPTVPPSASPAASSSGRPTETGTGATSTMQPDDGDRLPVANPGFEVGTLNDGTIHGWYPRLWSTFAPDGTGSYNIVGGGAYRGDRYASVRNLLKPYQATLTSSRMPFSKGDDVAVSVWVRAIAARPILEIYVNWYDRSGALISSDFVNALATDGVRTWQESTGVLAAPADAAEAQILLYEASGSGATIGIDQVTARSGDFIPEPVPPKGRPATFQQLIDNLLSIFGSSSEGGLEGSKQFRLAWWGTIIDYTVFGDYFWTGKGFGVNLADDDGFQSTVDHSLRSPHNSEMTVLARMGVPGLLLWALLQGAFVIGLLRALTAHRRGGDTQIAVVGGLILVYWVAMMIDTSFDPYLEGPQGGIWFWVIFGLGLVVMRIAPKRPATP
jgi:hypothetical protein